MSHSAPASSFELPPELYDALVDWPRRLEREAPFYQRLFEEHSVQNVLDVACGTGHHAALFNSWGLSATGADVNIAMIAHCRGRWGETDRLRWIVRSFDQPHAPPASFDAAICVGNSLSIAPDLTTVERVLAALIASIRPTGVFVVQVLNLWRLDEGTTQWQKCKRIVSDAADRILLKGIHRVGGRGFIDFVTLELSSGDVSAQSDTTTILGLEAEDLEALARRCGATNLRAYGDYDGTPYRRKDSPDLIIVGHRGA